MIKITDKSKCSGCSACLNACPNSCIEMQLDNEGFSYPKIKESNCINCGLCEKTCPIISPTENKNVEENMLVYAAYTKDVDVRKNSSSGGVFTEFAKYVLDHNGVVFGATFDENWHVKHICVEDVSQLKMLRGSKYIQSAIGDAYNCAKDFLEQGRLVLFSGTPCQIEGLYSFLGKDYDNLVTQDIICHGVPSQKVWDVYINRQKKIASSEIKKVSFRNKDNGWAMFNMKIAFDDGSEYVKVHKEDAFMKAFLSNLCLRPSCYNCSFKSKTKKSDITLADFWGIQHIMSDFNDNMGTSLLFLNSSKAKLIFDSINNNLVFQKIINVDEVIKYNYAMTSSVKLHPNRKKLINNIEKKDIETFVAECMKVGLIKRVVRKLFLKNK